MGYQKEKRPLAYSAGSKYTDKVRLSTATSTGLEPRGVWGLVTAVTSSGAPVVYTLAAPVAGDQLSMVAVTLQSSSVAPFHVNGGSAVFSYATATTGADMVTLATQGAAFTAVALNSTQWLVTGIRAATFSTST